jgi:hypothetical protein
LKNGLSEKHNFVTLIQSYLALIQYSGYYKKFLSIFRLQKTFV